MSSENSENQGEAEAMMAEQQKQVDELVQAKIEELPKTEVSATAIAKMAGLATSRELKLLEGKLDLITGRMANIMLRVERVLTMLNSVATGADLERVDVQIGSLKSMLRESLPSNGSGEEQEVDMKAKLDGFMARHSEQSAGTTEDESGDK